MKLTLGDLLNCSGTRTLGEGKVEPAGLSKLIAQDLDIKILSKLDRLINSNLEPELKRFQEMQRKLFEKFGEEEKIIESDEDGNEKERATGVLKLKPENFGEYNKQIREMLQGEIEVLFEPISLEDIDGAKLNYEDLKMLKPLMSDYIDTKMN